MVVLILLYVRSKAKSRRGGEEDGRERSSTSTVARLREIKNDKNHWANKLKTQVKILAGFFQIVGQFKNILQIKYPSGFDKFLSSLGEFFNIDALKLLSLGCMFETNFYSQLLVMTVTPLVLSTMILSVGFLATKTTKNRDYFDSSVGAFLWLTYLVFVSVSTTVFFTFGCIKVGDDPTNYLIADRSISCDSPSHSLWTKYAIVMVFVYPIRISFLYAKLLWSHREKIQGDIHAHNPKNSSKTRTSDYRWTE